MFSQNKYNKEKNSHKTIFYFFIKIALQGDPSIPLKFNGCAHK